MSVYRHQGQWKYDFWKANVRHQEGGFPTKQEAKAQEFLNKYMDRIANNSLSLSLNVRSLEQYVKRYCVLGRV